MIKIAIADRHQIIHDSFSLLCNKADNNLQLILGVFNCYDLEKKLDELIIDVLIIDSDLPMESSTSSTPQNNQVITYHKQMRQKFPDLKVLIFTDCLDNNLLAELHMTGINSYVKKSQGYETLIHAITSIVKNGNYFFNDLKEMMILGLTNLPPATKNIIHTFSKRQIEIGECGRLELTSKEIGKKLGISEKAVEKQKSNMMVKVDCKKFYKVIE